MSTGISLISFLKKRSTSPEGKALDCASAQMPICQRGGPRVHTRDAAANAVGGAPIHVVAWPAHALTARVSAVSGIRV